MISNYKELDVWKKSMEVAIKVYELVKFLPPEEKFCLSDQMRRAVISIPSNIAEGNQRYSSREYKHFLTISKGSLAELETQLLLSEGLGYLEHQDIIPILSLCTEIGKMLTVMIRNLEQKEQNMANRGDKKIESR